jgi:E-phenylitaconyl-CoA hydratase
MIPVFHQVRRSCDDTTPRASQRVVDNATGAVDDDNPQWDNAIAGIRGVAPMAVSVRLLSDLETSGRQTIQVCARCVQAAPGHPGAVTTRSIEGQATEPFASYAGSLWLCRGKRGTIARDQATGLSLHSGSTTMSRNTVLVDLHDHLATLTLNRPAVRNAMNRELRQALLAALTQVRDDPTIRVAILTGADGTFSAGADLKERAQGGGANAATVATVIDARRQESFARFPMEKPMLAAIDGYCHAAGFELALTWDIRICTPNARFGLPEISRGFFPGGGGSQRLIRAIPQAVAMARLLTGAPIDAATVQQIGLVSRIVPPEAAMTTARQLAPRIAGHVPLAPSAPSKKWPQPPSTSPWSTRSALAAPCAGSLAKPRTPKRGHAPSPSTGRPAFTGNRPRSGSLSPGCAASCRGLEQARRPC